MNLLMRKASARWKAGAKGGTRSVTTDSGVLKRAKFSLEAPLKSHSHTDPAELIAAAHATSFSLALSDELGLRASAEAEITTVATVSLERLAATGWELVNIHLNVVARLPGVSQSTFIEATVRAKTNCLVSKLFHATVSMNAKLEK